MTSKATVKRDTKWRNLALAVLALTLWQAVPVQPSRRFTQMCLLRRWGIFRHFSCYIFHN